MYLYIKLRLVILLVKFSKFVTYKFLEFKVV